jgi:hypothetical protein
MAHENLPHHNPFTDITPDQFASAISDIKLSDEALLATSAICSDSHPVLYAMTRVITSETIQALGLKSGTSFNQGALAGYATLQRISEATGSPLPTETSSGDLEHDLESNYTPLELTREKFAAAEDIIAKTPEALLEGDIISRLSVAREFAQKYPQYYDFCLRLGARSLQRPVTFFDEFLKTGNPKTTPQIIGTSALQAIAAEQENYRLLAFMHGYTGMVTLLLDRRERDSFYKEFGFKPTSE